MASACRGFTRAFFTSSKAHGTVYNVAVIGAGVVGTGVAQVAAQAGHNVALVDLTDGALQRSRDNIIRSLDRIIKQEFEDGQQGGDKFRSDVLSRISLTPEAEHAVSDADLVIEAVQEDLERKIKVFKQLDLIAPKSAVFVTNTSSYSIRELAKATRRADRFGALHFFNPVTVLKLVEVIRSPETSDESYAMMLEFSQSLGKTSLLCKDTPGFIVNRLLVPYLMEAVRMLERGDAGARDIDTAMKLGAGYPMGPIQLLDFVGLDVCKSVIDGWHKLYPNEPLFKPSPLLDRLVSEGNIGVKVGKGFYTYK